MRKSACPLGCLFTYFVRLPCLLSTQNWRERGDCRLVCVLLLLDYPNTTVLSHTVEVRHWTSRKLIQWHWYYLSGVFTYNFPLFSYSRIRFVWTRAEFLYMEWHSCMLCLLVWKWPLNFLMHSDLDSTNFDLQDNHHFFCLALAMRSRAHFRCVTSAWVARCGAGAGLREPRFYGLPV